MAARRFRDTTTRGRVAQACESGESWATMRDEFTDGLRQTLSFLFRRYSVGIDTRSACWSDASDGCGSFRTVHPPSVSVRGFGTVRSHDDVFLTTQSQADFSGLLVFKVESLSRDYARDSILYPRVLWRFQPKCQMVTKQQQQLIVPDI